MKRRYLLLTMVMALLGGMGTVAGAAEEISWSTQADSMRGQNGQRYAFHCPPGGAFSSRLWGTGTYTDDSSICTAAVHAGVISRNNGGNLVIEIRPGQPHYSGSHRHGLSSKDYGSYGGSFVFVSAKYEPDQYREERPERHPVPGGDLQSGQRHIPADVSEISWSTQANSMRGQNGQRYAFHCPPGGTFSSRLWGTGTYTDDSSICTAAVHAGLISRNNGGNLVIEIRPGQSHYRGSHKYGLSSQDYGSYDGSFIFVSAKHEPDQYREERPERHPVPGGFVPRPNVPGERVQRGQRHVSEISWTTTAGSLRGQNGQQVTYFCHGGGSLSSRLWGSRVYTDDSSICTAAVHAGRITTYSGGEVTIEIMPGQRSYQGSKRNGVSSKSYGSFSGSFMFVQ